MNVQFYQRRSIRAGRLAWRWRIVAGNGRKIAASTEGYYNKKEAEDNFAQITGRDPQTGEMSIRAARGTSTETFGVPAWSIETLK
jgi:uncharacterized protein YegP (UPF0339 family)